MTGPDRSLSDGIVRLLPAIDLADCPGTGAGVVIAVIDSGYDDSATDHRVRDGMNFTTRAPDRARQTLDENGHGTAIVNLILDVAPNASIIPIKIFGARLESSPTSLITAIDWALAAGANVINLSLGTTRREFGRALFEVCTRAADGRAIVIAAHPARASSLTFPAVFEPVLAVADCLAAPPPFVVHDDTGAVECFAAGRRIVRGIGGRQRIIAGASVAAPVVSGLVARLLESQTRLGIEGVRRELKAVSRVSRTRIAVGYRKLSQPG